MDDYGFCPIRGEMCNTACEWMQRETKVCIVHPLIVNAERIANALEEIVSGPIYETETEVFQ